jgi:hypothetical protein
MYIGCNQCTTIVRTILFISVYSLKNFVNQPTLQFSTYSLKGFGYNLMEACLL